MKKEIMEVARGATEFDDAEPYTPERRAFLVALMMGLGGIVTLLIGIPVIGVILQPLLQQPTAKWRSVGKVGDFALGTFTKVSFANAYGKPWGGVAEHDAAFVRRDGAAEFTAFSAYCQHLGCPVRWDRPAKLFFCPCHGGVYYANGAVAAGPPPRPLQRYKTRVRNGQVEIQTGDIPFAY